jgi:drug/metabolite transporter (DMT)-like permease
MYAQYASRLCKREIRREGRANDASRQGTRATMSARLQGILLIVLVIGVSLIFQVQMKLFGTAFASALAKSDGLARTIAAIVGVSLSWRGVLVGLLACAQFVIWLMALARIDLSLAVPMLSLGLLVVALSGGAWLGEDLNQLRIAGLCLTAAGIGLVIYS